MALTETGVRRLVLGAGMLLAAYGAGRWWLGERTFARMRPTTCTLVIKSVEPRMVGYRKARRGLLDSGTALRYGERGRLVFAHTVGGRKYTFSEEFTDQTLELADYEEGKAYSCRYDPRDPGHATIRSAFDREAVDVVLTLSAMLLLLAAFLPGIWRRAVAGAAEMRRQ